MRAVSFNEQRLTHCPAAGISTTERRRPWLSDTDRENCPDTLPEEPGERQSKMSLRTHSAFVLKVFENYRPAATIRNSPAPETRAPAALERF